MCTNGQRPEARTSHLLNAYLTLTILFDQGLKVFVQAQLEHGVGHIANQGSPEGSKRQELGLIMGEWREERDKHTGIPLTHL